VRALAVITAGLTSTGCLNGLVYTNVVRPVVVNFNETPVQKQVVSDDVKRFQYRIRIEWGDEAIGTIAREHGFTRVHYADLQTRSFFGVWTQRWLRVYGESTSTE
jgi:hypothetical protein